MPTTKAQQKAVNKYIKGKYDRLNVTIPKGRKVDVEKYVRENGAVSVNGLVNDLLRTQIGMTDAEWKK